MPDPLAGLGLPPAPANPDDGGENPTATAMLPVPTPAPPTLAEIPEPAPEAPIEIPAGAENPDAVRNLIENERKAAREANARRRELEQKLREREEASLPLEDRIKASDQRAVEAEKRASRLEVGLAYKLPVELVDRLKGDSREQIEEDAKSLLAFLKSPAVPTPTADGGFQELPPAAKSDPLQDHNGWLVRASGRNFGA